MQLVANVIFLQIIIKIIYFKQKMVILIINKKIENLFIEKNHLINNMIVIKFVKKIID